MVCHMEVIWSRDWERGSVVLGTLHQLSPRLDSAAHWAWTALLILVAER